MERFFPQDQRYRTTSASPRTAGGLSPPPPPPLPPPVYSIRIDEPSFRPKSQFRVGGNLRFVVATANTRRHSPLLPIRGLDILMGRGWMISFAGLQSNSQIRLIGKHTIFAVRFVAAAQRLTMEATPKKRRRSETGRETAVAAPQSFAGV